MNKVFPHFSPTLPYFLRLHYFLHPSSKHKKYSYYQKKEKTALLFSEDSAVFLVGRGGFGPPKSVTADLQSARLTHIKCLKSPLFSSFLYFPLSFTSYFTPLLPHYLLPTKTKKTSHCTCKVFAFIQKSIFIFVVFFGVKRGFVACIEPRNYFSADLFFKSFTSIAGKFSATSCNGTVFGKSLRLFFL